VSEILCAVIKRVSSLILTSRTPSKDRTRKMKIMYLFPSTLEVLSGYEGKQFSRS